MLWSISTRWNTYRHTSGKSLIEENLELGFDHVELGYDLTPDLAPGVISLVNEGAVTVDSVHAPCPVPVGAPFGHPELLPITSSDARTREGGIQALIRTIGFASEIGARRIVLHAGSVEMKMLTRKLVGLCEAGKQFTPRYERIKLKLHMQREKKVRKHLDNLYGALERLLPILQDASVTLALENLPSWEAVPNEAEMGTILQRFDSAWLRYWHDIGHGQVRQNLGFIAHRHWLTTLSPWLTGMHIHDVQPPAKDHLMPPNGEINFTQFGEFVKPGIPLVLEPAPGTPPRALLDARRFLDQVWAPANPGDATEPGSSN